MHEGRNGRNFIDHNPKNLRPHVLITAWNQILPHQGL